MWKPDNKFVGEPLDASRLRLKEEVKPSLTHFAGWLATRDPAETYNIMSRKDCLLCRYASSILGRKADFGDACRLGIGFGDYAAAAYGDCVGRETVGAALLRARSLLQASEAGGPHPHS